MTTNPDSITLFCGAQVSPHTAEVYGFQMRRFADWRKREYRLKLEKAQTAHILAYKAALAGLAPATRARVIATVRAFYRWAKDAGIIKHDYPGSPFRTCSTHHPQFAARIRHV